MIPVQPKLFDTLVFLVENRDRVVEKEELLDAVWPGVHVGESTLFQTISALRKTLDGGNKNGDRYIATIPGQGYRFVALVPLSPNPADSRLTNELNGAASQGLDTARAGTNEIPKPQETTRREATGGRRWRLAAGPAAAFAIVGGVAWSSLEREPPVLSNWTITRLTTDEGVEWQPDWAPEGRAFVYSGSAFGSTDIHVGVTGSESLRRTTHPADDLHPRWSPDGRHIAFLSDRGSGTDLYLIPPYEGSERKLTGTNLHRDVALLTGLGSQPWSPNSDSLLFPRRLADGRIAVWRIDLSSGAETQVTSPPVGGEDLDASWSHDGRRIAFRAKRGGERGVWIADLEGNIQRRGAEFGSWPAWSLDDRSLYVSAAHGSPINIWQVDLETQEMRQVTRGAGQDMYPSVSDTGSLAYSSFSHILQLHRVDLTTGVDERLVAGSGRHVNARVSPDGRRIAYQSNRSGNGEIWIHNLAGGADLQLTRHPAVDSSPDWSPDGGQIVFRSMRNGDAALWIVDAEGGEPRRLASHINSMSFARTAAVEIDSAPRWSPDGTYVGYVAPSDAGIVLWRVTLDGEATPIPSTAGLINFDWYLDSRRVILTRVGDDGAREMVAMDLSNGSSQVLHRGPHYEIDVAADGGAVSFSHSLSHMSQNAHFLRLTRPDPGGGLPSPAGEPQQATDGKGAWHVHNAAWFPDGKSLVYTRDTDQADIFQIHH